MGVSTLLLVAAVVLFTLAALGIASSGGVLFIPAGLMLLAAAELVP